MHFYIELVRFLLDCGDAGASSIGGLKITLVINKSIVNEIEICQDSARMSLDFSIGSPFFNNRNKCVLFVTVNHPNNG